MEDPIRDFFNQPLKAFSLTRSAEMHRSRASSASRERPVERHSASINGRWSVELTPIVNRLPTDQLITVWKTQLQAFLRAVRD